MSIDLLDRKILYELDRNCRATHAQIAKAVKSGRNVVAYRIRKLEEQGIIRGYFAEINNHALGLTGFRAFFRFAHHDPARIAAFFGEALKDPRVAWCFSVKGQWDADIVYWAKSRFEFYRLLAGLKTAFSDLLAEERVAVIVDIWHFPKRYLVGDKRDNHYLFSETDATVTPEEGAILRALAFDSRKDILRLSRETDLSVNTAKKYLASLLKKKVILAFRPFIDIAALGYRYSRLHLTLRDHTEEQRRSILTFLSLDPDVVYLDFYINGADVEIEYHVPSEDALDAKIDVLLSRFGAVIAAYETVKFEKEHVVRYLPGA